MSPWQCQRADPSVFCDIIGHIGPQLQMSAVLVPGDGGLRQGVHDDLQLGHGPRPNREVGEGPQQHRGSQQGGGGYGREMGGGGGQLKVSVERSGVLVETGRRMASLVRNPAVRRGQYCYYQSKNAESLFLSHFGIKHYLRQIVEMHTITLILVSSAYLPALYLSLNDTQANVLG